MLGLLGLEFRDQGLSLEATQYSLIVNTRRRVIVLGSVAVYSVCTTITGHSNRPELRVPTWRNGDC